MIGDGHHEVDDVVPPGQVEDVEADVAVEVGVGRGRTARACRHSRKLRHWPDADAPAKTPISTETPPISQPMTGVTTSR